MWAQARRALPAVGGAAGMETPGPGLALAAPTAAFLAQAARLRRAQTRALLASDREPAPLQLDPSAVARAEEVLRGAGQVLSEHESKVVLRGFGVEITRQAVASSASGAAQYADTIGYPVVLKAVSPDLRRKQELGAVVLGLTTSAAVRRAYATIVHNVETHAPTAHLDGVLVAEQAPEGLELHCGAIRLHTGEMAIFGRALGIAPASEASFALAPLSRTDARLLWPLREDRARIEALVDALKPSRDERARVLALTDPAIAPLGRLRDPVAIRRLAAALGRRHLADATDLLAREWAQLVTIEEAVRGAALGVGELAIGGKDLVAAGVAVPGPGLGKLLAALLDWVLEAPERNSAEALLALARALAA